MTIPDPAVSTLIRAAAAVFGLLLYRYGGPLTRWIGLATFAAAATALLQALH